MNRIIFIITIVLTISGAANAATFESDTLQTSQGPLVITFLGHATLYFEFDGKVIHIDPWSRFADYSTLPKADLILITHEHRDHFDIDAIEAVRNKDTEIVLTQKCAAKLPGIVMVNGDQKTIKGFPIHAVPAYNIKHMRKENQPYHPKGEGNGYVISLGDKNVYIAGDTENIPEMKSLNGKIDIAFLPMNLPYTMTPEMTADAARMISPKILYPYHFGKTNVQELVDLLRDTKIDVRIRKMN